MKTTPIGAALLTGALLTSSVLAGDCIDYGSYIRSVGSVGTAYSAQDVEVVDDLAYVVTLNGLEILDLSTLPTPTYLGIAELPLVGAVDVDSVALAGLDEPGVVEHRDQD